MTRETVDGRAVSLRRTKTGWAVRWGRTVIANCRTWQEAVQNIIALYLQEDSV